MLVQINNNSKNTPDYIYLTMHGTATATPVQAYLIVYGLKDWSDSVNPEVYDHVMTEEMFEYDNGNMKMNTTLDMAGNKFKNVPQPTVDSDVLTKGSIKLYYLRIYGIVYTNKQLITNNLSIGFAGAFIHSILLMQQNKYLSQRDKITISYLNTQNSVLRKNYPFTFASTRNQATIININHHFTTAIFHITTQTAVNIPYMLTYSNIYI